MKDEFRGISFPFRIGNRGGVVMSGVDEHSAPHIEESIEQILLTLKGERLMEHHVGSELDTCIYEPNEEATHNLIKFQIAESLNAQEPRIEVSKDNITLTDDGVTVYANIIYTLKAYNTTHVYNTRIGGVDNEN